MTNTEKQIVATKELRKNLDEQLQNLKNNLDNSREKSIAITKLQETIMWLGMNLKQLNDGVTPYTESYNPKNTVVHPTDGNLNL